jgi:hypothetical protein
MIPRMQKTALALALAAALDASAVSLNGDGLGQALIYPYYTVRSTEGANYFNTYVSVVNHASDAKAVRVRVREGRAAKEVLSFNLYLSPNDVWTAGILPTGNGAHMVTIDRSCTDPAFLQDGNVSSLDFGNALYTGSQSDGFGDTLDRTREGYIEMIEMATLTGTSAIAVTHNSAGVPVNCAAIRVGAPLVAAPTGDLSGTLTLINVNSGMDFTVNAEALADLSRQPFFRPFPDAYPDFAASEVDPVSVTIANGQAYRSTWNRGVDAVSAALMRTTWQGEYVLDVGSASLTDFVVTQPTRHHYVTPTAFQAPYSASAATNPDCFGSPGTGVLGEELRVTQYNREENAVSIPDCGFNGLFCPPPQQTQRLCTAVGVASIRIPLPQMPPDTTVSTVLGSRTGGLYQLGNLRTDVRFENGWVSTGLLNPAAAKLTSLSSSTRIDLATGNVTPGAHTYSGLPLLGFAVRTFRNGTLTCSAGACQGNYGGAFPFKYTRQVTP